MIGLRNVTSSGVLVALSLMVSPGCGDDTATTDCSNAPTFSEVTLFQSCTGCHATTLEGADRNGAPAGIDFDTYAAASQNAEHGLDEVEEGAMPPSGSVSDEEIQGLKDWINCGMPE